MALNRNEVSLLIVSVAEGTFRSEIPVVEVAFKHIRGGLNLTSDGNRFTEITASLVGAGGKEVDITYESSLSTAPSHNRLDQDERDKLVSLIHEGVFWVSFPPEPSEEAVMPILLMFRVLDGGTLRLDLYFSLTLENFRILVAEL
ncbi:MAG: hypothetical protein AB202_03665 [Parcubacteria bacterium C7867-007]|nr:MAG: hypothetical protein AB202_03665 [Parcubacteria bacterium C7867-007]